MGGPEVLSDSNRVPPSAAAFLVFLGTLAAYIFCAYPSIAPRDSADLAAAALSLGVAHPPGYPLYAVLGKAWVGIFRLGTPAYGLNVLSALCASAAVACLFIFLRRRAGLALALGSALALGFGRFFWKFGLLEEMYSVHALFLAVLVLLCDGQRTSFVKRISLSGLIFGLGLVNHQSLALFSPALFFLWHDEVGNLGRPLAPDFFRFCAFALLGLALELFLWIRLPGAALAWSVLRRAPYGTLTLFGPYGAPLTVARAWSLAVYPIKILWENAPLVPALALAGAWVLWRSDRRWFWALALGFLFFGPFYFLATRFDLSQWTVRAVLEPDFIAPSFFLCAFAALGFGRLVRSARGWAWPAALLLAAWPIVVNARDASHRNDFSAYDYARDLRRGLPPGSAAVVGGDTALFGLRYLDLTAPDAGGRIIASATRRDLAAWIESRMKERPVYVTGLSESALASLGLMGNPLFLQPSGLFQRIERAPQGEKEAAAASSWIFSVQRFASGDPRDSYVHDVRLCYGFAHYLSARLLQRAEPGFAAAQYEAAFAADPREYRIVLSSGKSL